MSHENPDKNLRWRDKLEDLDSVPGKAFNKEVAWDKLYSRLRGKQSHKKIGWYWIAAACSVIVLMIALVTRYTNKRGVSKVETTMKQTMKTNNPAPTVDRSNSDKNTIVAIRPKDESITPSHKSEAKLHARVVEVGHAVMPINSANIKSENAAIIPLPITNNLTAAQAPPPKKKLNVVHINELGDPVIEDPDVVRSLDKHKLKFGAGEVYANSPTGYKANDYNVLTAKL
jgi:hypothetical protein